MFWMLLLTRPGRFDRRIDVGLPDRRGRAAILAVHARSRPLSIAVNLEEWASRTPGFSGADLANLLNEAAILAARHNSTEIDDSCLEGALERITMGLSNRPLQDSAKKRLMLTTRSVMPSWQRFSRLPTTWTK